MQRYTVYFIWKTALHDSGGTSKQHQERKQLYLQHLVIVRLLSFILFVRVLSFVMHCDVGACYLNP